MKLFTVGGFILLLLGCVVKMMLAVTTDVYQLLGSNAPVHKRNLKVCGSICGRDSGCRAFTTDGSSCTLHDTHTDISILDGDTTWVKKCPTGFVGRIYGLQCYLVSSDEDRWSEAQEFCESRNAYLAEVVDKEEREAVWNYTYGTGTSEAFWLGIVQRDPAQTDQERSYKWAKANLDIPDNTTFWYNRFVPDTNYPPACGNFKRHAFATFLDEDCSNRKRFICEL